MLSLHRIVTLLITVTLLTPVVQLEVGHSSSSIKKRSNLYLVFAVNWKLIAVPIQ